MAKQNLASMYFGITEDFDRSMLYLQRMLGWQKNLYTRQKAGSQKIEPSAREQDALNFCNRFDVQLYIFGLKIFRERASIVTDSDLDCYQSKLYRHDLMNKIAGYPRKIVKKFLRD